MNRTSLTTALLLLAGASISPCSAQSTANSKVFTAYPGDYRTTGNDIIGIDHYITEDTHEDRLIYADYSTGVVRLLFGTPDGEFSIGPKIDSPSPVELKMRFLEDDEGGVTGLSFHHPNDSASVAQRIPLLNEDVTFGSGNVQLAGTLLTPETKGPYPAIILLHGSDRLTRYSFGPYPHFFTSLGFAVLVYDKRGVGASTGEFLDRSTYYPDDFVADAVAAFDFLRSRKDINPAEIGFWGSSEGGMLVTQVASRRKEVAFIIDSSGFMVPLWQQVLYHVEAGLRDAGFSKRDVAEAVAYNKQIVMVGRTGQGWERFRKTQEEVRQTKWFSRSTVFLPSLEEIQWRWTHVLSFDPIPTLKEVACPVLSVFGKLDNSTPVALTVENMRRGLVQGGNKDFTLKIFPNASHALMVEDEKMAPGVFETLSTWLLQRVHTVQ